jgi:hypothetical protein
MQCSCATRPSARAAIRLTVTRICRQACSSSIGVTVKRRCWSRSPVLKSVVKDAARVIDNYTVKYNKRSMRCTKVKQTQHGR